MRKPDYSTQFKRDFKKAELRGKEMAKLDKVMALLLAGIDLPSSYKDH
ncbi:MAG: type II toxin-antitoxin system YafQ family toxin [Desulfovibrionaceae bacterium]|nr:type II toxin-antitoxin system YafQ family toxin [Desulfovibrionaceae bacterium]